MRILALMRVSGFSYPFTNGWALRLYHICKYLALQHDLSIGCVVPETAMEQTQAILRPICKTLKLFPYRDAFRQPISMDREIMGLFKALPELRPAPDLPKVAAWLESQIQGNEFDAFLTFPSAVRYFDHLDTSKVILDACDCIALYNWRVVLREKRFLRIIAGIRDYFLMRKYEKHYHSRFAKVVFVSDADSDFYRTISGRTDGIETIPNGIDVGHYHDSHSVQQKPYSIVFSGNMAYPPNEDAGIFLLEKVFPLVLENLPEASVCLVGCDPGPKLLKQAKKFQKGKVEITGTVPDIRPYVHRAQVYISPLRFGAGLKNKILEAWAMQKAVVATPISCDGLPATHGQNALIGNSAKELAIHVSRLLHDGELRDKVAAAGYKTVRKGWGWETKISCYEKFFREVQNGAISNG